MSSAEKNVRHKKGRKRRHIVLQKSVLALLATLVAVPTILCIVLILRVVSLQNRVDDLLLEKKSIEQSGEKVTPVSGEANNDTTSTDKQATPDETSSSTESQTTTSKETESQTTTEEQTSKEEPTTKAEPTGDGKYAYLTFDDGPSSNTYEILDILDKYGVKATFFVNGHTGTEMEERYKAIASRGHSLGLHTYSHKYENVYGGLAKFEEEIVTLRQYLYKLTGQDITLFRFPGGSSNSKVDDIQPYIKWLTDNGYVYYDWNSSSGDATGKQISAKEIVDNSMIQAKEGYTNLVILMHDTDSKDTTVEALPELIEELLAYGYEIRAIDENSTPVQHRKLQ